ncbi:MAG: futalosine hydrolase [Desulfobacterales bacterium]|nr:futalosine hydrolase [Desulfobacterales bacterium]
MDRGRPLILCATAMELAPFLEAHPAQDVPHPQFPGSPIHLELEQAPVDILITGPGMANTLHGLTAFLSLDRPRPSTIFNLGIAGAFESNLASGELVMATEVIDAHTGVTKDRLPHAPLPFDLIPGHGESRQGHYPLDATQIKHWAAAFKDHGLPVRVGPLLTVSAITGTPAHAHTLHQAHAPLAEAMEGAAGAHIAALYHLPFMEIRSISNPAGVRDKSQWNIPLACRSLAKAGEVIVCHYE